MSSAFDKDQPAIRSRLEALGYTAVEFEDYYGFLVGLKAVKNGERYAVRIKGGFPSDAATPDWFIQNLLDVPAG